MQPQGLYARGFGEVRTKLSPDNVVRFKLAQFSMIKVFGVLIISTVATLKPGKIELFMQQMGF